MVLVSALVLGFIVICLLAALGYIAGTLYVRIKRSEAYSRRFQSAQATPDEPKAVMLVVGDSLGVGVGVQHPAESVAGRLAARFPGLCVENLAQSGARSCDIVKQLERATHKNADVVLIQVCGNDVASFRTRAEVERDLRAGIEYAKQLGKEVILMPGTNMAAAPFFMKPVGAILTYRARKLYEVITRVAMQTACVHIDLFQDARNDPFSVDPRKYYSEDGLHPSGEGYALWFAELVRNSALLRMLERCAVNDRGGD